MSTIKRTAVITGLLALFLGFFVGTLCPSQYLPWTQEPPAPPPAVINAVIAPAASVDGSAPGDSSRSAAPEFNEKDNFPLLNLACALVQAMQARDYETLASFVHPERGVTFTPYSSVNFDTDLTFTSEQIKGFSADQNIYTWGIVDGRGSLIEMTPEDYFSAYVFNADYTQAPQIGVDKILQSGNALENLSEAYPGCRFVEFHFPGLEAGSAGLDWCSLKLVFAPYDGAWRLVGIVHSQWTI